MANNNLQTQLTIRANVEGANEVNALATSLDNVNNELTQTTNPASNASAAIDNLGSQAGQSVGQTNQLTQAIQSVNTGLSGTSTPANSASNAIDNLGNQMTQSADDANQLGNSMQSMASGLTGLLGALGVGIGVQEIIQLSDEFNNLESRVRLATESGGDFNHAMASIREIADHTTMPLTATGDLFTKLTQATRELGYSQSEVLGLTKTISEAMAVSGGDMASMEAGLTQLAQGLSSGALRGDELNSVLEQSERLARALAEGIGVGVGELKNLGAEGKLTAEVVGNALKSQADKIAYEYSQMPATVSGSLTVLKNSLMGFIGQMDNELSGSNSLANFILDIANNIKNIDPSVIDGLKNSLASVGEVAKVLLESVSAIPNHLGDVLGAMMGLEAGAGQVSLLQGLMNGLALTTGAVADGFKALQIVIYGVIAGTQTAIAELATSMHKLTGFGGDFAKSMSANAKQAQAEFEKLAMGFESSLGKAMDGIGTTTEQKLQEVADKAKASYDKMAQDGQASTTALEVAFKDYAHKAIQANGGVVDEVLKQELAQKNLQAVVDNTGKVTITAMNAIKGAVDGVDLSKHEQSFKALGIDMQEFAGGLSSKANTALTAFNDLAGVAGTNANQLAMAYNGAKQAIGNNAQGLAELDNALLKTTKGNAELANSVKSLAQEQQDAKTATADQQKALQALGVSMSAINAGMSKSGKDMADNLKIGLSTIKDTAKGADELKTALNQALDTALASAKTKEDFKAIQTELQKAGLSAQASAEQMQQLNAGTSGGADGVKALTDKAKEQTKTLSDNQKAIKQSTNTVKELGEAHKETADTATKSTASWGKSMSQELAKIGSGIRSQMNALTSLGANHEQLNEVFDKFTKTAAKAKAGWADLGRFYHELNAQTVQSVKSMTNMDKAVTEANSSLSGQNLTLANLTKAQETLSRATAFSIGGIIKLDKSKLNGLKEQIRQAKQQMDDMANSAKNTMQDLESELASLQGREIDSQRIKQAQKLADLQAKMAEAVARGNSDEIAHYSKALSLQKQINDEQNRQATAKASEQAMTTWQVNSTAPATNATTISATDVANSWNARLEAVKEQAKIEAKQEFAKELMDASKRQAY